jgi:hypothetical protein
MESLSKDFPYSIQYPVTSIQDLGFWPAGAGSKTSPFALVLTGTPLENRPDDLFSAKQELFLAALDPEAEVTLIFQQALTS